MSKTKKGFRWPLVNSGPSWTLPRISMPDYFSIQWDFPLENYLIVGHAIDADGGEYSISLYIGRVATDDVQVAALGVAVGIAGDDLYYMGTIPGLGASDWFPLAALYMPPATDFSCSVRFSNIFAQPPASGSFVYEGGPGDSAVGISGAPWSISFSAGARDEAGTPLTFEATLIDDYGTVMEDMSGYNAPPQNVAGGLYNNEAAQPRLRITGGTLGIGDRKVTLVGGNLWNDRQVYTYDPAHPPAESEPMYYGCWIPLVFDSGLSGEVSPGWPIAKEKGKQWLSGRKLNIPPSGGHGNLFFAPGTDRYNGGAYLTAVGDDWDFDLNIFDPDDSENSPHWQSPETGIVYCTKWWLRFHPALKRLWGVPDEVFLVPFAQGCEYVQSPAAPFWEGAGRIYADRACTRRIGYCWIEQMGYN